MTATEIKEALRSAASVVSKYVLDVASLNVETQTVDAALHQEPVLAARTLIKFDGDNTTTVPARLNDTGKWEIDTVLYNIHVQNVQSAIDYRTRMLDAMLSLISPGDLS